MGLDSLLGQYSKIVDDAIENENNISFIYGFKSRHSWYDKWGANCIVFPIQGNRFAFSKVSDTPQLYRTLLSYENDGRPEFETQSFKILYLNEFSSYVTNEGFDILKNRMVLPEDKLKLTVLVKLIDRLQNYYTSDSWKEGAREIFRKLQAGQIVVDDSKPPVKHTLVNRLILDFFTKYVVSDPFYKLYRDFHHKQFANEKIAEVL